MQLAACAVIGEDFGYDEINLNVGCPSDRVQEGRFGACLMAEPALVAEGVAAMKRAVRIPVTVKCRIGIDDQDPEVALRRSGAGGRRGRCRRADRSCAQGLAEGAVAAREPRHSAARLRPGLPAEGRAAARSRSSSTAGSPASRKPRRHLQHVDGVMLGRAAYKEPWRLLAVDAEMFGDRGAPQTMKDALDAMRRLHRPAKWRAAPGCIRSRATCWARSTPCPARGLTAAISPRMAAVATPARRCCAMPSR